MMRLRNKGGRLQFDEMNYHGLSSQSLSSVSELDWYALFVFDSSNRRCDT
jgi:hypothetical protein